METTGVYWFVGAMQNDEDLTAEFVRDGVWRNGYEDKYLDLVKSVKVGDRIAIKAAYTRKKGLPFDNREHTASVMSIKATGIVTGNSGDGHELKVQWNALTEPREWFFFTSRFTVWRIIPDNWMKIALIDFAFNNKPQDLNRFRNDPFWAERFGDTRKYASNLEWIPFFEEIADKLLGYKNRRSELIKGLQAIGAKFDGFIPLMDKTPDGKSVPLEDICPFTTMASLNRQLKLSNRIILSKQLADFLEVKTPVPRDFDGVPTVNNQNSWFFGRKGNRAEGDIDGLWDLFETALKYADNPELHDEFIATYDKVSAQFNAGWLITIGMFWARPWSFLPLDNTARTYIINKLNLTIGNSGHGKRASGSDYMNLINALEQRFQEPHFPVHSIPELSMAAWRYRDNKPFLDTPEEEPTDPEVQEEKFDAVRLPPYTVEDILTDGCFIERPRLMDMLIKWREKKNLILQGPPGTGKTWLARRLAYALMEEKAEQNLRAVQFHANLSYEDFVRGYRPVGDGKLALADGPFMEIIQAAVKNPDSKYVVLIEEINRGQPARIFGEMLTLLEADKRTPDEALELCYHRENERVYIPDNLYVIGTMNVADRSLALVDMAFRRRFAFINLEPTLNEKWMDWVHTTNDVPLDLLREIRSRVTALNVTIAADSRLGTQFRIGHSYFTPERYSRKEDAKSWYRQVVETEIGPLLDEYWYDDPEQSAKAVKNLVEGI
ncbi:AAA family ATPase [Myxococcota bacterium]|nr:AAA family ATPase [Myxococcota bacterium]MBU1382871.1 AAA family ATPase [Myxococcota bacterium]MBU1496677.1 AAA family ATPase [Myxococcota bacterium]